MFRAVLKIGQLQENFANAIGFMNPPAGLSPEDEEAFYNTLMAAYDNYIQRAMSTYENGLKLAVSNGIRTEYTDTIAVNLDLLIPGLSADVGYSVSTSTYEDTTLVEDSTDAAVGDGFTPETADDIDESDTTEETELPDSEYVDIPAIEPYTDIEDEDSGGGCFLWPF